MLSRSIKVSFHLKTAVPCVVGLYRRFKFIDVSKVFASFIITLTMEAASTSETSVNSYQTTWLNKSEDSCHHTRRRQNLKPHFLPVTAF
jgi:hypothetical protein